VDYLLYSLGDLSFKSLWSDLVVIVEPAGQLLQYITRVLQAVVENIVLLQDLYNAFPQVSVDFHTAEMLNRMKLYFTFHASGG
jgi:hypothetical protein